MKTSIKRIGMLLVLLLLVTVFGCEKKTDTSKPATEAVAKANKVKPPNAPSKEIIDACRLFEPPWGEQNWSQWWQENPELGEKWFTETPLTMKTADLNQIKRCTHLKNMLVAFAPLKDLSVFKDLTGLTRLDIRFALNVTDLTPLENLTNLTFLGFWSTSVSDLSPLSNMKKLKEINARMTKIVDLTPLKALTSLEKIDLLQTTVSDISVFATMPSIKEILVCTTKVSDLSPLYPVAKQYTYLDLCNTPFTDFKALKRFENLTILKLWGVNIGDLSVLSDLHKLDELDLSGATFDSLLPLKSLTKLRSLTLIDTPTAPGEIDTLKAALPELKVITTVN